ELKWPERIALIIGALMLIMPGLWNNIVGFVAVGLILAEQLFLKRRQKLAQRDKESGKLWM
ncbi:unnamed protein product, partial [marine sediment metagenome]